jgi:hypothetical protein
VAAPGGGPGGAKSTQRLSCSGWYESSTGVKPSTPVNQAIASS